MAVRPVSIDPAMSPPAGRRPLPRLLRSAAGLHAVLGVMLLYSFAPALFPPQSLPHLGITLGLLAMPACALLLSTRRRWMWPLAVGLEFLILAVCLWMLLLISRHIDGSSLGATLALLALLPVIPLGLLSLGAAGALLSRRGREAFGRDRPPPPPVWSGWSRPARIGAGLGLVLLGSAAVAWAWRSVCIVGLKEAVMSQDTQALRHWMRLGADPAARLQGGARPLHRMAELGEVEAVRFLLDAGVPPDSLDDEGDTPLVLAAYCGNLDVVRLLVERGASTEHRNAAGRTAREAAYWAGHHDVVRYLDPRSRNPFHLPLQPYIRLRR